jgi:tetratricopeptide (TPR) repeat protein
MFNLAAVYNRCGKYDSAVVVYEKMYALDSTNVDALTGIGKYFNQMALEYMDSMKTANKADDTAAARGFTKQRDMAFDSAKVYFRQAFDAAPDDQFVAEELGVVCYVTEDYDCAIPAFKKLTELQPDNADNWTSLGDSYLKTRQWDKAARAYEKVVEIEPNNKPIWESLEALYKELGETENIKKAQAKLKEG